MKAKPRVETPKLLTLKQAAKFLGITAAALNELREQGSRLKSRPRR